MFYSSRIQKDNRVSVPWQFLGELGGVGTKVIIAESPDHCLCLFPSRNLAEIKKILGKLSRFEMVTIKSEGRIPISNGLRAHAGLEEEVVFADCGNYIEIWDKEVWDSQKGKGLKNR